MDIKKLVVSPGGKCIDTRGHDCMWPGCDVTMHSYKMESQCLHQSHESVSGNGVLWKHCDHLTGYIVEVTSLVKVGTVYVNIDFDNMLL